MTQDDMDEFGKLLVQQVRDQSLRDFEIMLRPGGTTLQDQRWHAALADIENPDSLRVIIRDIVDLTVFSLLNAIDQEILPLSFHASSGNTVNLSTESIDRLGMLYHGRTGWNAIYSAEPVVDNIGDMDVSHIGDADGLKDSQ